MITDRMKDLATYYDSHNIIDDLNAELGFKSPSWGLSKYGIDMRGFLSSDQSTKEKLAIIEQQIKLQSPESVGYSEKMKGTIKYLFLGTSKDIDSWYKDLIDNL